MVAVTLVILQRDSYLSPGQRREIKNLKKRFKMQQDLSTALRPRSQSMAQQGKGVFTLARADPTPQQWLLRDSGIP